MKPIQPKPQPNPQIQEAVALHQAGRLEEAAELIQKLLRFYPKNFQLLTRLGTIHLQQGKTEPGISLLDKSLQIEPQQSMALFNRANGLAAMGKLNDALAGYDRVVAIQPGHAEAHYHRSNVLMELNRPEEALAGYDRVIALKPQWAEVHHNRGRALQRLGKWDAALAAYQQVTFLEPDRAEAYNNQGVVLRQLNRLEEALAGYDRAIALKPEYAEAHNNRGAVLQELKRLDEALAAHDRAIGIKPDYAEAYLNKALLKLLAGDYAEGWRLYERRMNPRKFSKPLWTGREPLANKTVLVHAEHGLGDGIQYVRYARLLEKQGAKVVWEAPPALVSVILSMGNLTVTETGKPLPAFDFYCPMMSLPFVFGTTLETIPAEIPYLFADEDKRALWREKLGIKTRPRVGLAWSGNPAHTNDYHRSLSLENLKPLLELPLEFHSLQKAYREKDMAQMNNLPRPRDHAFELNDFSDTAALIAEMDWVVSVDTSVAHLAGAIGKPVWILLPYVPDYRWLWERSNSPWYPTATLFRQPRKGDWKTVIHDVVLQIKEKN